MSFHLLILEKIIYSILGKNIVEGNETKKEAYEQNKKKKTESQQNGKYEKLSNYNVSFWIIPL